MNKLMVLVMAILLSLATPCYSQDITPELEATRICVEAVVEEGRALNKFNIDEYIGVCFTMCEDEVLAYVASEGEVTQEMLFITVVYEIGQALFHDAYLDFLLEGGTEI